VIARLLRAHPKEIPTAGAQHRVDFGATLDVHTALKLQLNGGVSGGLLCDLAYSSLIALGVHEETAGWAATVAQRHHRVSAMLTLLLKIAIALFSLSLLCGFLWVLLMGALRRRVRQVPIGTSPQNLSPKQSSSRLMGATRAFVHGADPDRS